MKRIYLDWGIISNLKKNEYADLLGFFLSHKDRLLFVYSQAHLDDLMRSDGDPRLLDDLNTLTCLVDDHLLSFDKTGVKPNPATPSHYYDDRREEPPVKLAEYGNLLSSLDSSFPGGHKIGSKLKAILQSLSFPIPQVARSNSLWGNLLPDLPANPSVLDIIQSAGLFVDKMQDEENYYKNYRAQIHKSGFKLDDNAGNWTDKDAIQNISDFLESKGIKMSFMELVKMPFGKKRSVSEYECFISAYTMLDLLGYRSDKLSKPRSTINSILSDAQHAYLASFCDCFITEDRRLASKAKALYHEFGIDTCVLASQDAVTFLHDDIRQYDLKYFFSFLQQELTREDAQVERYIKENNQDTTYDTYKFSHRLLGIFPRGILYDSPEERKEQILVLDMGTGRSTTFLFDDEVAMIVDLVSDYMSAEPIPDYASIKEAFVRRSTNISVIWTIRNGKIILRNNEVSLKPELIVVQSTE